MFLRFPSPSRRIDSLYTSVLPAHLLSDEPLPLDNGGEQDTSSLRAEASRDGVSFVRVVRLIEDNLYLARVASAPERVSATTGYTVLLSTQQLLLALPWDVRLYEKSPAEMLALLHHHATALASTGATPEPPSFEADPVIGVFEVPASELHVALHAQDVATTGGDTHHCVQRTLLHLALAIVAEQVTRYTQQPRTLTRLPALRERQARLTRLYDWHREYPQTRQISAHSLRRPGLGQTWSLSFALLPQHVA